MTFDFNQADNLEGSNRVNKEGTYHFIVTNMDAQPHDKDGNPIDGLQVKMEVLAGTNPDQKGKIVETTLYRGRDSDKDGGEMARRKLTRLMVALGGAHSPGGRGSIDPALSVGRQIVVKIAKNKGKNDKEYFDINYSDIYHIDDPAIANCPKDADALDTIPAQYRIVHSPATPTPAAPAPVSSVATAATSAVNIDDL